MDEQGFVDIALIASFNRIKKLTSDVDLIAETMALTPLLELNNVGGVRLRGQWTEWLLPGPGVRTVVEDKSILIKPSREGPAGGAATKTTMTMKPEVSEFVSGKVSQGQGE